MGSSSSKTTSPMPVPPLVRSYKQDDEVSEFTSSLTEPLDQEPPPYAPLPRHVGISVVDQWQSDLLKDAKNRLAISAFTTNAVTSIISQGSAKTADQHIFNITIPVEGNPITNQNSSGRCWIFASTNIFRVAFIKKYNLKEFELSQSYLFFWDKIEKANYFLEQILDTLDEDIDSRLMQALLNSPVQDGGQWDFVANLVEKYGLIPKYLYPDSYNANHSTAMGNFITSKLREDCIRLRGLSHKMSASALSSVKDKILREVYTILTIMLGPPPSATDDFTWQYKDASGHYHSVTTTPRQFAAGLSDSAGVRALQGTDVNKLFSLVNDPRNEYFNRLTISRLGNVVDGRAINYVNVPMSVIKTACVKMLSSGLPVFFGCDVGKFLDRSAGVMDPLMYDYELGFNVRLAMTKAERLQTHDSAATHAMVLTGVHVEQAQAVNRECTAEPFLGDGKTSVRWRIENSWGPDGGDHGYYVMTDRWMDEYCYQAVVDPRYVTDQVREVLKKEAIVLPLWDPLGTLA